MVPALFAFALISGAGHIAAGTLNVDGPDGSVAALPMPERQALCLHWAHSVTGGPVADCFENRGGQLVLTRSFLHDFAAGLGMHPERGSLVSAPGGGYWIEGIDMALPRNRLVLRTGGDAVGHRLRSADGTETALPPRARLVLTLTPLD